MMNKMPLDDENEDHVILIDHLTETLRKLRKEGPLSPIVLEVVLKKYEYPNGEIIRCNLIRFLNINCIGAPLNIKKTKRNCLEFKIQ